MRAASLLLLTATYAQQQRIAIYVLSTGKSKRLNGTHTEPLHWLTQRALPALDTWAKGFDRVVFVLHGLITGVPLAPPTQASTATEKRRVMRLRLPARYGGLGLRARSSWLKCAAFLGAVDQALPSFIDRVAANGAIEHGIFPSLTAVLGVGSFNTGGSKYATILASNTRMGRQLSTAWQQLQAVVRGYTHMASEEVRLRPSPLAPPPSAFEAATNREPTSLLGRIASPT